MPRPRLRDEIDNWNKEGVKTIVSLLETAEILELGLDGAKPLYVYRDRIHLLPDH
jgi:hypothetical protein